jgi:hypothetical protein
MLDFVNPIGTGRLFEALIDRVGTMNPAGKRFNFMLQHG